MHKPTILTGDRTTGPLHLGHLVGTLRNRIAFQDTHKQFVLLADSQALTDNVGSLEKIQSNVIEVTLDYLAVGIDPDKTTICLQSHMPALAELSMLYLNFVNVARLERNPTIKDEIRARGFGRNIPAGFLCYPAAQAADITAFRATVVPVGEDQRPLIELTNEIVRRINSVANKNLLQEVKAIVPKVGRLPSPDGASKMSKSAGNAILLSASRDDISRAVKAMYTDPNHLRIEDPGRLEGNVVFTYLDAFDDQKDELAYLKQQYKRGGLGDMTLKTRLDAILQEVIEPIRDRRAELAKNRDDVVDVIRDGTMKAKAITEQTKLEITEGLGLFKL